MQNFLNYGLRNISKKLTVTFNKEGSTIFKVDNEPSKATFLLSSAQLWADTGLEIKPSQKITIDATGRANLAIHRLVESAEDDVRPTNGWLGPDGDHKQLTPLDEYRRHLQVLDSADRGTLLAYICQNKVDCPDEKNPRPIGIEKIGHHGQIDGKAGTLFLTINDGILDNSQKSHDAYVSNQVILNETYGENKITVKQLESLWKNIIKQNYWNVWFDDNVGDFLIQISFDNSN